MDNRDTMGYLVVQDLSNKLGGYYASKNAFTNFVSEKPGELRIQILQENSHMELHSYVFLLNFLGMISQIAITPGVFPPSRAYVKKEYDAISQSNKIFDIPVVSSTFDEGSAIAHFRLA